MEQYAAMPKPLKDQVTSVALDYLSGKGIYVSRQALARWRRQGVTSPLAIHYKRAYEYALHLIAVNQAVAL